MSLFRDPSDDPERNRSIATRHQEAEKALEDIVAMQDDPKYAWAAETLTGIYDTISSTGRCTYGQRRAIDNIMSAKRSDHR